jgi:hypothetical protein
VEHERGSFDEDRRLNKRLWCGLGAVALWFLFFAIGVLIPSEASRMRLGWKPPTQQLEEIRKLPEAVAGLQRDVKSLKDEVARAKDPALLPPEPSPTVAPSPTPSLAPTGAQPSGSFFDFVLARLSFITVKLGFLCKCTVEPPAEKPLGNIFDFLLAMCSFIPLNVAILCILAAFIGGCTENKTEIERLKEELKADGGPPPNTKVALTRRLAYLTEHPGHSAIRGLVVYLIIMSGLFIVGAPPLGDPSSQQDSLSQYVKLAGLLSFFGYLAGYDPTVFTKMLNFGAQRLNSGPGDGSSK